ncbi:MAG: hypothetical protein B7Y90_16780 [Alphaproteobacteria bacterium 32-64-14]|nr:MAG: hypothetical protein B7Y90_16780 [Alphaproteobacteria bacterium 32-64-14]
MPAPHVIRNNAPIIGWVFACLWFGMLLNFTTLYVREGGFGQFPPAIEAGIMLAFWLAGVAGLGPMLLTPRTRLTLHRGYATLHRAWLVRRREQRLSGDTLATAIIVHDTDSDGDPWYRLSLTLPGGDAMSVKESNDLSLLEALHAQLLKAS